MPEKMPGKWERVHPCLLRCSECGHEQIFRSSDLQDYAGTAKAPCESCSALSYVPEKQAFSLKPIFQKFATCDLDGHAYCDEYGNAIITIPGAGSFLEHLLQ